MKDLFRLINFLKEKGKGNIHIGYDYLTGNKNKAWVIKYSWNFENSFYIAGTDLDACIKEIASRIEDEDWNGLHLREEHYLSPLDKDLDINPTKED